MKLPSPPPTGQNWDEETWIMNAERLADEVLAREQHGRHVYQGEQQGPPPPPPGPPRPETPPRNGDVSQQLPPTLMARVEAVGLDALTDWYPALDQVYELSDMTAFSKPPRQQFYEKGPMPAGKFYDVGGGSSILSSASSNIR